MSGKSKNTVVISYFVIAVIYFVLFLAVPFEKNVTTWVAFAFGCIAIIVGAMVSYISFDGGQDLKSKVYGFPMFRLGYYYTTVQIILTIALFIAEFFADIPVWISIVFGIVLLGALVIGVTAIDNTRDIIQNQEMRDVQKTQIIENLRVDIDSLVRKCADENVKKEMEKLAEEFKYSDPISSEVTKEIEDSIKTKVEELKIDIDRQDGIQVIKEIHDLLIERNKICKNQK